MAMIIVKAQVAGLVREISKQKGFGIDNITSDFFQALDRKVRELVDESVARARENGRKTLMARDI
ncbi:DUF1931 domain-containing protein [Candidatus Woesearchaeota archaeon]|nr:DUF1931 domain-containing protein [Candidatus Woesearchaeota archaeon]